MLAVALFVALATPSPAASPAGKDLPEIGRVHSTYLCTVLHERVAPAVQRLNRADRSIDAGKNDFLTMGHDQLGHLRAAFQLDQVKVENEVGAMVKNLAEAGGLLKNASAFPANPDTEDGRIAADLKQRLQTVMNAQEVALNALNGTIETERLGEMQSEGLNILSGVVGPERQSLTALPNGFEADEPVTYIDSAGLPTTADLLVDPRSISSAGLVADTTYGKIAIALYDEQIHIALLESRLTAAIVPLQRECIGSEK